MAKARGRVEVVCVLLLLCLHVKGDYRVLVHVSGYENPSNRCEECGQQVGLSQTCCDAMRNNSCTGSTRCDNQFHYCLRQLDSQGVEPQLADCDLVVAPEINENGADLDFDQSTLLGLPNPLPLTGISREWEGVQLYIEVRDSDLPSTRPGNTVDAFLVDIPSTVVPGEPESEEDLHDGIFGWAYVELSYSVECLEGYRGQLCDEEEPCLRVDCGSGECVNLGEDDFECECPSEFFGEFCERRNSCFEVDCGNGDCELNQNDSFTCVCDDGYTGQFCQRKLTESPTPTSPAPINNQTPAIAGAIVGVVILLLLLAIGIAVFCVLLRGAAKKREKAPERPEEINMADNNYIMSIKKQPLAIKREEPELDSGSYTQPEFKPPQPDDFFDGENSYAVPDTASMQTRMTVNVAYGQRKESAQKTPQNGRGGQSTDKKGQEERRGQSAQSGGQSGQPGGGRVQERVRMWQVQDRRDTEVEYYNTNAPKAVWTNRNDDW